MIDLALCLDCALRQKEPGRGQVLLGCKKECLDSCVASYSYKRSLYGLFLRYMSPILLPGL